MKKAFKILLYLIIAVAVIILSFIAYIQIKGIPKYDPPVIKELTINPTPEKVEEGARISSLLCSNCHLGKDGRLSGGPMKDLDPSFGKVWSRNITNHPTYGIGKWTPGEIAYFLRTGVRKDGTYAPIWMPKFTNLSDADLECIICFLKSDMPMLQASEAVHPADQISFLSKFLCNVVFKPMTFPDKPIVAPDTSDRVAYGKYVLQSKIECFTCHSADFKKLDMLVPEHSMGYLGGGNTLIDLEGRKIYSANITPDPVTGIGKWTYEDFYKAMKEGKRPDGKLLRYPMTPKTAMKDFEIQGIWAYLQTVPRITNVVDRTGL